MCSRLQVCLEEMPQHVKTFQSFQNMDEYGNVMVPTEKMDELKRRCAAPPAQRHLCLLLTETSGPVTREPLFCLRSLQVHWSQGVC